MKKAEAIAKRDEVLQQGGGWKTVESVVDKNKQIYPVTLHNIIFKEGECCVLRLAAGGHGFDIHITPEEDGKLDFGVSCALNTEWFSSKNLKECIDFIEKWFTEHKRVSE